MGWQDWVPVLGPASKGDWKGVGLDAATGGLYSPLKGANDYFFEEPANDIKRAYDQASGQADQDTQKLMDFYKAQQGKALDFYKPLQSMFNQSYGTSGIAAPQTPRAPGARPLQNMYTQGGGR